MASPKFHSTFVDGLLQQGAVQSKVEDLIKVIKARGLELTKAQRNLVASCADLSQLATWFDQALVRHPGVHAIGFIGSSATGAKIAAAAGLKRVALGDPFDDKTLLGPLNNESVAAKMDRRPAHHRDPPG